MKILFHFEWIIFCGQLVKTIDAKIYCFSVSITMEGYNLRSRKKIYHEKEQGMEALIKHNPTTDTLNKDCVLQLFEYLGFNS